MAKQGVTVVPVDGGFGFEFNGKAYGPYTSERTAQHMAKAVPAAARNSGHNGVLLADARGEARRFRKQ